MKKKLIKRIKEIFWFQTIMLLILRIIFTILGITLKLDKTYMILLFAASIIFLIFDIVDLLTENEYNDD